MHKSLKLGGEKRKQRTKEKNMHEHGIVICNIKGKWEETLNSHRKGLTNDGIFVQQTTIQI